MEWITEINAVQKPHFFVDNQLKGPYSIWHHQHFFEETPEGIIIRDIVTYKLPFGKLGEWVAGSMVRKKIEGIFKYRSKIIAEQFK